MAGGLYWETRILLILVPLRSTAPRGKDVNLIKNPERNTGYNGSHIWQAQTVCDSRAASANMRASECVTRARHRSDVVGFRCASSMEQVGQLATQQIGPPSVREKRYGGSRRTTERFEARELIMKAQLPILYCGLPMSIYKGNMINL